MKNFILIILFLIFLLGIAWVIWTGFLRESEIEDVFTPVPQDVSKIKISTPPEEGWNGK